MGYYIETGANLGKGEHLVQKFNATKISRYGFISLDPANVGLVIIRNNFLFEAAAFIPDLREKEYWLRSVDPSILTYYKMDLQTAKTLAGYKG